MTPLEGGAHIVLGSGPAAVMCAHSLLSRGLSVIMVDPGESLEEGRASVVDRASRIGDKQAWGPEIQNTLRENTAPNVKGLPKKLVYGSDFAFRWREPGVTLVQNGVDTLTSHATGGLSNAWGANVLPLIPSDVKGWPLAPANLEPFYEKVTTLIPISARRDRLEEIFPLYGESGAPLPQSAQAVALLRDLESGQSRLRQEGVYFGASRLAVRVAESGEGPGCVRCGLCLYGCPHRLIYSSAQSMQLLESFPQFRREVGWVAHHVREEGNAVIVVLLRVSDGIRREVRGVRAYVGCGAINSTALMARSLGAYGEEIRLLDSQYFLTPFLRFRGVRGVMSEELHTLSQIVLEIFDSRISPFASHVLFYTYNDLYLRALQGLFGPASRVVQPALAPLLGRLLIVQGYLHSDLSGRVVVRVERHGEGERVVLSPLENPLTRGAVRRLHGKLLRLSGILKGLPVQPMSQVGPLGKSYHLGGSFPMTRSPTRWSTDLIGRVTGLSRIHLVDASIFPSVPATNITFPAMANAYRIGQEVPRE